jgi:transcriptional regulator with XRE-family HTH domain
MSFSIDDLGAKVSQHRAQNPIRKAAAEIGIGHATLSRIENGHIPDLETFAKICAWLGEDAGSVLGMKKRDDPVSSAAVHFRSKRAPSKDTAAALGDLILNARRALIAMSSA